jgi:DNA-binding NarL/FixJ family response regulator
VVQEPGGVVDLVTTAVVADRMPLVRVGLATSLRLAGLTTVEQCGTVAEALEAARRTAASLVVIGTTTDDELDLVARRAPDVAARLIVLVGPVDQAGLVALLDAGVVGVALRTIAPEDMSSMARAVMAGERSIAPALMSVLVGFDAGPARAADGVASLLTAKERQVLARLAQGESNAAIAEALYISPATVKSHLTSIYAKLDVRTRLEATSRAVALGLLN